MRKQAKEKIGCAIIIGGGPAGLTAAYELIKRSNIKPIILEAESQLGGISKTINHNGNRIDIGGHRFFSKSDRVMNWWLNILPLEAGVSKAATSKIEIGYQNKKHQLNQSRQYGTLEAPDDVMLLRPRVSRILYQRKFYDYPIGLSLRTLNNLGYMRSLKIGLSYLKAFAFPIRNEKTLRDFLINRFGHELYETFFKDYTEKVWGVPCDEIPASWGAQRIKGLSVIKLISNIFRKAQLGPLAYRQKNIETSLIEQFLYPKFGPGQLWEKVAEEILKSGGKIHTQMRVEKISNNDGNIEYITATDSSGKKYDFRGDHYFSTMPVSELFAAFDPPAPQKVACIAKELPYRDFMTVGLLLNRINLSGGVNAKNLREILPDNWIYIQEPDVKVGRIQIFNNWSPYLVANPDKIWIGLEYFLNQDEDLWQANDSDIVQFAIKELEKLGICDAEAVEDSIVVRTPKAYPAYFGSYEQFDQLKPFLNGIDNLHCIGRNGMHRYNNQDHSMLTAMQTVDGILEGRKFKEEIWKLNTDDEYHEVRKDI